MPRRSRWKSPSTSGTRVDATDKVVTVSLTQADTLLLGSLSPDEDQQVEVQIRGRTEDGRAFASNIMTAPLSRILKDGVI